MPDVLSWDEIEQDMERESNEATQACICRYCGSKRKPSEYKKNNKYHCENCSAEWPTLFDNFFWVERCGDLYDDTRKTLSLSRSK